MIEFSQLEDEYCSRKSLYLAEFGILDEINFREIFA